MPTDTPAGPLVATIRDLCAQLSAAPLTAADLAAAIGEPIAAGAGSIRLRPAAPALREGRIVVRAGTAEPAHLELTLADPAQLRLRDLHAAFGPSRSLPRARPGAPQRVTLPADTPGAPYTCTIVASLQPHTDNPEDATIATLTLRRDERLAK